MKRMFVSDKNMDREEEEEHEQFIETLQLTYKEQMKKSGHRHRKQNTSGQRYADADQKIEHLYKEWNVAYIYMCMRNVILVCGVHM